MSKTIHEAAGTLLIVYMVIHEQDLIVFEERTAQKVHRPE